MKDQEKICSVVKKWIAERCPAQLKGREPGKVPAKLLLYIADFIDLYRGGVWSLEHMDEACNDYLVLSLAPPEPGRVFHSSGSHLFDAPFFGSAGVTTLSEEKKPEAPKDKKCPQCGIPMRPEQTLISIYCSVCYGMFQAIEAQPGLAAAQAQYEAENRILAKRKRQIMGE